jgi:hypothetical protein
LTPGGPPLRPVLAIVGSVLSFALLIEAAGLIPTVIVAVAIASRGSRELPLRHALLFGVALALATTVLFVFALGQPFPLVGRW